MTSESDGPVGQICSHVSGDEDGQIIGWSFNVGDGRIVYCGEISNRRFAELDEEEREALGGKPFGWFLMCYWPDRSEVWAKCAGDEQARALVTLIGSMLYAGVLWRADDAAGARAASDGADPLTAAAVMQICRTWLDGDDPSHWGSFERALDALICTNAPKH